MFRNIILYRNSLLKINNNVIFSNKNRNYISFNLKDLMSVDIEDGIMENSSNNNDLYPKCRYEDGKYISPWCNKTKQTLLSVIYWQLEKPKKLDFPNLKDSQEALQHIKINKNVLNSIDRPHATWMGHASCYFQTEGVFFLTDPMWSDRASPTQLLGPKRYTYPPIDLEELTIDVVLLSHTHYDHLDYNSAMRIGNKSLWIVPLGVKEILTEYGITNCVELNWWDTYSLTSNNGNQLKVVFTPSKHWTSRSFFDRNTCLWGGFAIISPTNRFFFAGDTAYCSVFKTIGEHLGPFDFSAIPIGAYEPRWFMKDAHCDPEEAVQIHKDIKSKQTLAIHWGTFPLADEDVLEPALELARTRILKNVSNTEFFTMANGETIIVGDKPLHDLATVRKDIFDIYINSYKDRELDIKKK